MLEKHARFAPSFSSSIWQSKPPFEIVNHGWQERWAFEYYFHQAGPTIESYVDPGFWRGIDLDVGRSEPAVMDAQIAIKHDTALSWYLRSIANTRHQIAQNRVSPHTALIPCVLYICIETLRGHIAEALQLYEQGSSTVSYDTTLLQGTITPMFIRPSAPAMIAGGYSAKQALTFMTLEDGPAEFSKCAAA
ncbi:hypothetical protein BBP40_011338 [Aspergillus hancockii]|nr:hypothetical protein BBP40_011338 [Aspergillus hancockii]